MDPVRGHCDGTRYVVRQVSQNRTEQNRNSFISSNRRTVKYNTIKEKIIKVLLMGWMVVATPYTIPEGEEYMETFIKIYIKTYW